MNQKHIFANMQTAMDLGNADDYSLGGLVIVSALFTEFALAEILFAEAEKIDAAADKRDASVDDLAELDNSVARVLEQVCCNEGRIIEKIDRGITLRGFEQSA